MSQMTKVNITRFETQTIIVYLGHMHITCIRLYQIPSLCNILTSPSPVVKLTPCNFGQDLISNSQNLMKLYISIHAHEKFRLY